MEDGEYMHYQRNVKWPAALAELYDIISDGLKGAGYKQEDCQSISGVVLKALSFMAGGRQFYIPTAKVLEVGIRNNQLLQDFNGANVDDLARKYGLGIQQVYAIIRKQREIAKYERKAILHCQEGVGGTVAHAPEIAKRADLKNRSEQ